MNLVLVEYLPGAKIKIKGELTSDETTIPPLNEGIITGMDLINPNNPDEGVEYTVKLGDWVLTGVSSKDIERR